MADSVAAAELALLAAAELAHPVLGLVRDPDLVVR